MLIHVFFFLALDKAFLASVHLCACNSFNFHFDYGKIASKENIIQRISVSVGKTAQRSTDQLNERPVKVFFF